MTFIFKRKRRQPAAGDGAARTDSVLSSASTRSLFRRGSSKFLRLMSRGSHLRASSRPQSPKPRAHRVEDVAKVAAMETSPTWDTIHGRHPMTLDGSSRASEKRTAVRIPSQKHLARAFDLRRARSSPNFSTAKGASSLLKPGVIRHPLQNLEQEALLGDCGLPKSKLMSVLEESGYSNSQLQQTGVVNLEEVTPTNPMTKTSTSVSSPLMAPPHVPHPKRVAFQNGKSARCSRSRSSKESRSPRKSTEKVAPSVALVENVAAVKVFFETYYNSAQFVDVSPRSLRRRRMEICLELGGGPLVEREAVRGQFLQEESNYLRQMRVTKGRKTQDTRGASRAGYEIIRALGRGSFGVVNLVRDRRDSLNHSKSSAVYAMKVIKKAEMLQNSQEGHLRAERDFLVSCAEHSNWIVPLVASFQDPENLYLVMEFMIGGDFLTYLIHKADNGVLDEDCAQFYVAEMILCVEETHRWKWIHRDVKPDNFLISASGHLKIADFGLAFDGHWAHTQSYYVAHRYHLLDKLGIKIEGDVEDIRAEAKLQDAGTSTVRAVASALVPKKSPAKIPPPSYEHRKLAKSVVGTSQYMAPEVVRGTWYDGRCDWWSIGIILFECLYGFTPFCRVDREETKRAIREYDFNLQFPRSPQHPVSPAAMDLMWRLLQHQQNRLCSQKYFANDFKYDDQGISIVSAEPDKGSLDYAGRHVYPNDADDIKRHPFFAGLPWDCLHLLRPPWVPDRDRRNLAKNFDPEEQVLASSSSSNDSGTVGAVPGDLDAGMDGQRLAKPLKQAQRARDKLLRDPKVAKAVLEARKRTAFLGYTYRRPSTWQLCVGLEQIDSRFLQS